MLEEMRAFFDSRLDGYEEHQLNCIESAREFYRFTAEQLPRSPDCAVLDIKTPRLIQFNYPSADFAA